MQHIGEVIRQVRRLRNLTQQELAGERFSKSYVSAIEHHRTAPSTEVLRYFAEQLGQPEGDFTVLLQQPDVAKALVALKAPPSAAANGIIKRDEALCEIDVAVTRLSDLTEELLDVTRLQTGRLLLHRTPSKLVSLARRVAAFL